MGHFLNSSCVLCGESTSQCISLCLSCQQDLPRIKSACSCCGIPTPTDVDRCGLCLKSSSSVDYTFSLFQYESPVDYLISQLKFNQQLSYAAILGHLLKQSLTGSIAKNGKPDIILPVPLHKSRLVKRGFNQSLEIARPVSKALRIPIDYQFVRRTRKTMVQSDLTAVERRKNIKNCFEMTKTTEMATQVQNYKHVVIVDDVVTTGSTTNELAKVLKKSGVEKVGVWTIGRAII